jgi:hypothetical protein
MRIIKPKVSKKKGVIRPKIPPEATMNMYIQKIPKETESIAVIIFETAVLCKKEKGRATI